MKVALVTGAAGYLVYRGPTADGPLEPIDQESGDQRQRAADDPDRVRARSGRAGRRSSSRPISAATWPAASATWPGDPASGGSRRWQPHSTTSQRSGKRVITRVARHEQLHR